MTRLLAALAAALCLAVCMPAPQHMIRANRLATWSTTVRATHYYATGYPMATGFMPFIGAVACSSDIGLYATVTTADGMRWQCLDTGLLDGYGFSWVDFYAVDAESIYGQWPTVLVEQ